MLETQGRVVAVEAGLAWVESERAGGCGSCSSKGACGSQLLGEALTPTPSNLILAQDPIGVHIGDTVLLGVTEQGALRAAFLMYGLPIVGLLIGVLVAQPWGDAWAMMAGGLGLGLALVGVWLMQRLAPRDTQTIQPMILACVASAEQGTPSKMIPIHKI